MTGDPATATWALAVRPTPFHRLTAELSRTNAWIGRLGWTLPEVYDTLEAEHAALRSACVMSDRSALATYAISGPDAAAYLNRAAGGCGGDVGIGTGRRVALCDDDGALVADGLVLRPRADTWLLTLPLRALDHLLTCAVGFEVAVEDASEAQACLAVDGPSACAALLSAGLGGLEALRPGGVREITVGRTPVTVARVSPTGGLGYELRVPVDDAEWLWARIARDGAAFNLRAAGEAALDLARLEAGHARPGIDYESALDAAPGRRRSPLALGLGGLLAFDGAPFTGRRALEAERAGGATQALVGLTSADPEAAGAGAVFAGRTCVGRVTSIAWSPAAKRVVALSDLDAAGLGTSGGLRLQDAAGTAFEAAIVPRPFVTPRHARRTPPAAF